MRKYTKGELSDELASLCMERECFKSAVEEMANHPRRTRATWEENYATLSNKIQNNEFIVKDNLYKWYLHQLKRHDLDSDKAEKIKKLHLLFKNTPDIFKNNSESIWKNHYNQLVDYYHEE